MPKCNLVIDLDDPTKKYVAGDKIKGRVNVDVDEKCKCNKLTLECLWKTHGLGNKDSGSNASFVLFEGEWSPGEFCYEFELTVPSGPRTYIGRAINIDWYLIARADIPWAFDPKAETTFVVTSSQVNIEEVRSNPFDFKTDIEFSALFNEEEKSKASALIASLILFVSLVFLVVSTINLHFFGILFGVLLLSATLPKGRELVRQYLAMQKLGEVKLKTNLSTYRSGENIVFKLNFSPKANIKINGIVAYLLLEEVAISGSGTNRSTHRRPFRYSELRLDGPFLFYSGGAFEKSGEVQIPEHSMHSFKSNNNSLLWYLIIKIDVDGWPDWERKEPILVGM